MERETEYEPFESELTEEEREELARREELDRRYAERRKRLRQRNREKLLAESLALTVRDIEYALRRCRGVTFRAAQYLGVDRKVLYRKIQATPSLRQLQVDIKEEYKDVAEEKLLEQIEQGVLPAITLYLKTQAKDRGYTEKSSIEHGVDTENFRNAATLINAMRRGVAEAEAIKAEQITDKIAPVIESMDYEWVEQPESNENQSPTN